MLKRLGSVVLNSNRKEANGLEEVDGQVDDEVISDGIGRQERRRSTGSNGTTIGDTNSTSAVQDGLAEIDNLVDGLVRHRRRSDTGPSLRRSASKESCGSRRRSVSKERDSCMSPQIFSDDEDMNGSTEEDFQSFLARVSDDVRFKDLADDCDNKVEHTLQLCWNLCKSERERLQARVDQVNAACMKQVTALKIQLSGRGGAVVAYDDLVEFYEPLRYLQSDTKELVLRIISDKVEQIEDGKAPSSLVKAIQQVHIEQTAKGEKVQDQRQMERLLVEKSVQKDEKIAALSRSLEKAHVQRQQIEGILREKDDQIAKLSSKLDKANELIQEKDDQVVDQQRQMLQLQREKDDDASEKLKLSFALDQAKDQQQQMEQLLKDQEYQLLSANDLNEVMRRRLQDKDEQIVKLTLKEEKKEEEARTMQASRQTELLNQEKKKLDLQIAQGQTKIKSLHQHLAESKTAYDRLAAEVAELEKQLEKQQGELEQTTKTVQAELEPLNVESQSLARRKLNLLEMLDGNNTVESPPRDSRYNRKQTKNLGTQTKITGNYIAEKEEENRKVKGMLEEQRMKINAFMTELKEKGLGKEAKDLCESVGLDTVLKARSAFDRLYNDAMDRVQRMEKLREKHKGNREAQYIPTSEDMMQAIDNSTIEKDVRALERGEELPLLTVPHPTAPSQASLDPTSNSSPIRACFSPAAIPSPVAPSSQFVQRRVVQRRVNRLNLLPPAQGGDERISLPPAPAEERLSFDRGLYRRRTVE